MCRGYAIGMRNRSRLLVALTLTLATSVLGVIPAQADQIEISCPSGGSYSITLPAGVATNGKSCVGQLDIDSRVKIIGKEAFSFSKVTSVNLPNSVTTIEANAFSYTSFLTINLGNSITSIGSEAFRSARFLSIQLPNTLRTIGECAFCDTYFSTIKLPNSLVSIGKNAFIRDTNSVPLKSIEIPDSVVEIGWYAFSGVNLEELKLGNSVRDIMPGAFQRNKIKKVVIPKSTRQISAMAFKDNPLEELELPDGLLWVEMEAFANTRLKSLVLPETAQKIGKRAFADIPTLKSLTIGEIVGQSQGDGSYTVGDIFEGSYAIAEIYYCGNLKGFIIEPTCRAKKTETPEPKVEVTRPVEAAPKAQINPFTKKAITITCVKGKITRKISAINPKCPIGYKKQRLSK